jgi:hypothetical protein
MLVISGTPITTLLLVTGVPSLAEFFSGPAVIWPVGSVGVNLFIGTYGIRTGNRARAGTAQNGSALAAAGWVAIGGAALLLGGLIGLIGGALLIASGSALTQLSLAKKA